jgi:bacterioferritin (cytochrome b1)
MINPSLMESIDRAAEQYNKQVRIAEQEAEAHPTAYLQGYLDSYEEHKTALETILIKLDIKDEDPKVVGFRDVLATRLNHS